MAFFGDHDEAPELPCIERGHGVAMYPCCIVGGDIALERVSRGDSVGIGRVDPTVVSLLRRSRAGWRPVGGAGWGTN